MTTSDITLFVLAVLAAGALLWWLLPMLSRKPEPPTLAERKGADLAAAEHEAYEARRDLEERDAHACMLERRIEQLREDLGLHDRPASQAMLDHVHRGVAQPSTIVTLRDEA